MRMKFGMVAAICLAVFFTACGNQEEKPETPTPSQETVPAPSPSTNAPAATQEPAKTEVSVGPDGGSIKTKDGTNVSVSDTGGSMGNKNVNLKVKTK